MDPKAVEKATERLHHAHAAVASMKAAKTMGEMQKAWIEFLIAANAIYSKLEQGAKANGTSQAWFGRKKHERKKDELLSYIHHARHSEEHTVEGTIVRKNTEVEFIEGEGYSVVKSEKGQHILKPDKPGGIRPTIRIYSPGPRMLPARDDRFHDVFNPPTKHLGKDFTSVKPQTVAETALGYLEGLVADAAKLAN